MCTYLYVYIPELSKKPPKSALERAFKKCSCALLIPAIFQKSPIIPQKCPIFSSACV